MKHRETLTIVVTGATGQQGGHLVRRLLAQGHHVRALTRNPEGLGARALHEAGAQIFAADLDHDRGLSGPLQGADAAFLVTTPFERGAEAEVTQARHFGRAARAAGLPHLVYSSVTEAMTRSPVEHFAAKGRAEAVLRELELPMTIIGAPPFLDNVIASWHLPWLRQGIFAVPGAMDMPMQWVATADIAAMAAYAIEHRDALVGRRVDIASDEISGREMMATLERGLGQTLRHEPKRFADLDPMLGRLFAAVDRGMPDGADPRKPLPAAMPSGPPPRVDLEQLRADYPDLGWHRFSDWVAAQDWPRILNPEGASEPAVPQEVAHG